MIIGKDIIQSCIITKRVNTCDVLGEDNEGNDDKQRQEGHHKLIDRIVDCE